MHFEPAMQMTLQVSAPDATEQERDLLRREYRLSQGSSEFWAGFDSLNARIHGATDLLRNLHSLAGDVDVTPLDRQSLLVKPEAAPVEPVSPVAALPLAPATSPSPSVEAHEMRWLLSAGVLGLLTLLLLRRRSAKVRLVQIASIDKAADIPNTTPGPLPVVEMTPAPVAPSQDVEDASGLKRHTVPAPDQAPHSPVDAVREEMDHALDLAEVLLTYGRTTGAMQTLKDYLHKHPSVSVRPWLKLLDLHRQTGMREDFERAAETVHRHFNVKVPGWDEGVSGVPLQSFFEEEEGEGSEILGLEQLPHILAQIQATWPELPCQEYLRHLLVNNRGGGRMGFPISVVAEILLLEDILNDRLAGHA